MKDRPPLAQMSTQETTPKAETRQSPPNNRIAGFILLWLCGLRLIVIGFDFRVFHLVLARGGSLASGTGSHRSRPGSALSSASLGAPLSAASASGSLVC